MMFHRPDIITVTQPVIKALNGYIAGLHAWNQLPHQLHFILHLAAFKNILKPLFNTLFVIASNQPILAT